MPDRPDTEPARSPLTIRLGDGQLDVRLPSGASEALPIGVRMLATDALASSDPPAPDDLTNAIGLVADHVGDLLLAHDELAAVIGTSSVELTGEHAVVVARVEAGRDDVDVPFPLTRAAAEDVFRTVATEARTDRAHNPGLPREHVDTVVAACCVVVGVMRRLELANVVLAPEETGRA